MKPLGRWRDESGMLSIDIGAVTLCLLVTVLFYLAAFRPLRVRRTDAAVAVGQLVQAESRTTLLDGQCRRATLHLNRFENECPDTTLKLEDIAQLNTRLDALMQLAQRCGLSIDGVQPGQGQPGRYFDVTSIELAAGGHYEEVVTFLRELHHTYEDISVQSFALKVEGRDVSGKVGCTFDLAWYTRKEDGPVGG